MKQEIKDNSSSKEFNPVKAMSNIIDAMADKIRADENKELFTGGDWYIDRATNDSELIISSNTENYAIASLYCQPMDEETEANASLLVQAKNMYYALKGLCESMGEGLDAQFKAYDTAMAILQKANPYLNHQK